MYTCMSYWSSVRSWYPDIGQVLFFAFCLRHVLNKELIICPKQYSLLRMTDGANSFNLVPRARVSFGQNQDTELRNNQFPETKILGLPVSRRMRALVWIASRDKDDVDAFHKSIQYVLERQGKSRFGFEITVLKKNEIKRHVDSGNELVDYSRAPCLGADQKTRGLRECGKIVCPD